MNRFLEKIRIVLAFSICQSVLADSWQPLAGREKLQALVSGATAEIQLTTGVSAVGTYNADGTAEIRAWNETFRRTWQVKSDSQVCYTSEELQTNCFTFEQNLEDTSLYRSRNVVTGDVFIFRRLEGQPGSFERETPADDGGGLGSPSAAEIAAALSDPNTTLGTMNFQFDYVAYQGDIPGSGGAEAQRMVFQPSLPYPIGEGTNLFVRPAIPVIINQDVPDPRGGFNSEGVDLGDVSFDASLGRSLPGGLVVLGGLTGTLPTASNDSLGRDQGLLGPEAAVAMVRPWGVLGLLVTQQWDVAGENDYDTNVTGGQYFYAFNLGKGLQVNGSPTFAYDHEASGGNKWTFPLAIGISQTLILGGRPWKFGIQYWHYIEAPDLYGPDYQIRLSISPVVKLPW